MRIVAVAIFCSLLAGGLLAQDRFEPGTTIPVTLNHTLDGNKVKPGQVVEAKTLQDLFLSPSLKLPRGSKVIGHIVETPASAGSAVSIRFDRIVGGHHEVPITTVLRAGASFMEVAASLQPTTGYDMGTSRYHWTTQQVGGDRVYRGGGTVVDASGKEVGKPGYRYARVRLDSANENCPVVATRLPPDHLQAVGVFSAGACGLYGLPDISLDRPNPANPGVITLRSSKNDLRIAGGSAFLLQVIP